MRTFFGIQEIPGDFGPSAVTVGKFDGVHAGHRAVIAEVRRVALSRGLTSVVVTFDRNPLSVLDPAHCPASLVSNRQKRELLAGAGLDAVLELTFDDALRTQTADEFVTSILVGALRARIVLVGADFRFGAGGAGTVETLRVAGRVHGFDVHVLSDVAHDGDRRVSSTWIRELLSAGEIERATELLGSAPTLRSTVVHGLQRGRTLGYPTANLAPDVEGFIPTDGVYAAMVAVGGIRYPAAVSIGNNPTFDGVPDKQVEAHLLDQHLDLYGATIDVAFVHYVRGMRKFAGADELAAQMADDESVVRATLASSPVDTDAS